MGDIALNICIDCVKHPALKKFIQANYDNKDDCCICGSSGNRCVNIENSMEFKQVFRALIRWYWSEWEYDTHIGGDRIEYYLYKENPILNHVVDLKEKESSYVLDEIIEVITWPATEDYKKGVSLFSGYYEDGSKVFPPMEALKNRKSKYIKKLNKRLLDENYFLHEDDAIKYVQKYLGKIDIVIGAGAEYFRSRIGYKAEVSPEGLNWGNWSKENPIKYKLPYTGNDIGAPPIINTLPGRMNRHGVSYLYLSSNSDTAISEVRPHPGHYVSIGKFRSLKDLKIADFRITDLYEYLLTDEIIDDEHYIFHANINEMFSMPITPEERAHYVISQFVSDVLRKLDYSGVAFKSSVGDGYNLTVFDPSQFEYVNDGAAVHFVNTLKYEVSEVSSPKLKIIIDADFDDEIPF